jgi:hypothetical protein
VEIQNNNFIHTNQQTKKAMKVIEQFSQSKTGLSSDNEDRVFVNDNFACVVDGGTSFSTIQWDGKTPGQFASQLVSDSISAFHNTIGKTAATEQISKKIRLAYKKKGMFEYVKKNPSHRIFASIALYSQYHSEVWLIGDCQCLIDEKVYQNKSLLGELLSDVRSAFLEAEIISGKTVSELQEHDTGREYLEPLLKRLGVLRNDTESQLAYSAIDGFNVNETYTRTVPTDHNAKHVILASDGYPELKASLRDSEIFLSQVLKSDPLMIGTHRSTKGLYKNNISFDDRAYLKIQL